MSVQIHTEEAADALLYVSSEVLHANLQDQQQLLEQNSLAHSEFRVDVYARPVLEEFFVLLARECLVLLLHSACAGRKLAVPDTKLKPHSVPYASWRQLLDRDLLTMVTDWAKEQFVRSQTPFGASLSLGWFTLEVQLQQFLRDRRDAIRSSANEMQQHNAASVADVAMMVSSDIPPGVRSRNRAPQDELRDAVIYLAAKRGLEGPEYCRFLKENGAKTPTSWWKNDGPREYPDAYHSKKFMDLIHKEKSRRMRRMELLEKSDPDEFNRILQLRRPSQLSPLSRSPKSPLETNLQIMPKSHKH